VRHAHTEYADRDNTLKVGQCSSCIASLIEGTANSPGTPVQHVRIDHRGRHITVSEQFLDRPYVMAGFQQMRCKRMPKRMAGRRFRHTRRQHGGVKRPLNDGLVQMMWAALAGDPIDVTARGRENPLPGP
jgi:hypothetical protein